MSLRILWVLHFCFLLNCVFFCKSHHFLLREVPLFSVTEFQFLLTLSKTFCMDKCELNHLCWMQNYTKVLHKIQNNSHIIHLSYTQKYLITEDKINSTWTVNVRSHERGLTIISIFILFILFYSTENKGKNIQNRIFNAKTCIKY